MTFQEWFHTPYPYILAGIFLSAWPIAIVVDKLCVILAEKFGWFPTLYGENEND